MSDRALVALSDSASGLSILHDAGEALQDLEVTTVYLVSEFSENGTCHRWSSTYVTEEEAELGPLVEEASGGVDDLMELVEWIQVAFCHLSDRGVPLVSTSRKRLRQKLLLVLEEQVERSRGESRKSGDPAKRPIADAILAKH